MSELDPLDRNLDRLRAALEHRATAATSFTPDVTITPPVIGEPVMPSTETVKTEKRPFFQRWLPWRTR